jgi:hypothetical protein
MPTFMFLKGGELVSQFSGADSRQLQEHVKQLKESMAKK